MADDILTQGPSPVDNLPAAQGKRRRGRPRKHRIEETANIAAEIASSALPIQKEEVKAAIREAVKEAVKRPEPVDPESVKGIQGLATQVRRAAAKKAVTEELRRDDGEVISGVTEETISDVIAQQEIDSIRADQKKPKPPHWWLLRMR